METIYFYNENEEYGYLSNYYVCPIYVDGKYYISEVNPRFGGGYPHAYESMADHMKFIVNNLEGKINECVVGDNFEVGTYMMKYNEVMVRKIWK